MKEIIYIYSIYASCLFAVSEKVFKAAGGGADNRCSL